MGAGEFDMLSSAANNRVMSDDPVGMGNGISA